MDIAVVIVSCLLWLWFLGCVITWRFGKVLLVEGMGLKSLEFVVLVLFSVGIIVFLLLPHVGQWILLIELTLWLVAQFYSHWYFTLFGATERKIKGYNKCFEGTVRLIPESDTRLIPDLYHILLHLLIAADLIIVAIRILD